MGNNGSSQHKLQCSTLSATFNTRSSTRIIASVSKNIRSLLISISSELNRVLHWLTRMRVKQQIGIYSCKADNPESCRQPRTCRIFRSLMGCRKIGHLISCFSERIQVVTYQLPSMDNIGTVLKVTKITSYQLAMTG